MIIEVAGTQIEVPDNATDADIARIIKKNALNIKPASVTVGAMLNDIPRQAGLTARYGLEGLAGTAEIVTEPIRYLTDKLIPDRAPSMSDLVTGNRTPKSTPLGVQATKFADWIGLPKPEGADERVVADATRLMAGSGGMIKGAQAVSKAATPVIAEAGKFLAANPIQQLFAAGGAGGAGGASREAGGSPMEQGVASFVGGVAGGFVPSVSGSAANLAKTLFNKGMTVKDLDVKISNILRQSGVDYNDIPERARQALRQELAGALQANKELDPAAVSRLLAFKEAGITPTRGMVSQNPVQISREQNLAKIGANSNDQGLSGLALIQNQNNKKMISNLNELGANRGDALRAGETVTGSILGQQSSLRSAEQAAWDQAKGLPGYRQPISAGVLSEVNRALDEEGMMGFLSPEISRYMAAFQSGEKPFTPQAYKNLMSMLATEKSAGGNTAAAARIASDTLLRAELKPAGFANTGNLPVTQGMAAGMRNADNAATDAISAIDRARSATRQAYAYEGSSPLVRSVLSEGRTADPQRIAQSYIIGGTAQEAEDVIRQVGPQGLAPIKEAILDHLKKAALSGASDETGNFSQAAFKRALNAIGERKLALIFSPEELRALNNNARVASLMMAQPVGSAVNNSNSGALLLGRGLEALRGIPILGPNIAPAIDSATVSFGTRRAQNVLPGLLAEQPRSSLAQPYLLPAIAAGGLLAP